MENSIPASAIITDIVPGKAVDKSLVVVDKMVKHDANSPDKISAKEDPIKCKL